MCVSFLRVSAYASLCALLKSSVPKIQEQAFEEREKYKEGKYIIEKAKVMKVCCLKTSDKAHSTSIV